MRKILIFIFVWTEIALCVWDTDYRLTNSTGSSWVAGGNGNSIARKGDSIWVFWTDNRTGKNNIWAKWSGDNGATWRSDTNLTQSSGDTSLIFPSVCKVPTGRTYYIFQGRVYSGTSFNWETYISYLGYASAYGMRVTNVGTGRPWVPSITGARGGTEDTLFVTWCDDSIGNWELWYRKIRATSAGIFTALTVPTRLTSSTGHSWNPSIACTNPRNVYVTWQDNRDGNFEIYFKKTTDGGSTWTTDTRLTSTTSVQSYSPSIAASGTYVHIVWIEKGGGLGCANNIGDVYYRRSTDSGASWGTVTLFYSGPIWGNAFPKVVARGTNVYTVWQRSEKFTANDSTSWSLYWKSSVNNGASWSPAGLITRKGNFAMFYPSLEGAGRSTANSDTVWLSWYDNRNGNDEIYYKRGYNMSISIEENQVLGLSNSGIEVYPNPFHERLNIRFASKGQNARKLKIYDAAGRLVNELALFVDQPSATASWDGTDESGALVSEGIYFILLETEKQTLTKKIILSR